MKRLLLVCLNVALVFSLPSLSFAAPPPPPPLTMAELRTALDGKPAGEAADRLAERIRAFMTADGKMDPKAGNAARSEGLWVAWALEVPGAAKVVLTSVDGARLRVPMIPVGTTGVWALVLNLSDGTTMDWQFSVDGRRMGSGQLEVYAIPRDNLRRPGVPQGKLIKQTPWKSRIYDGTVRDWWIYVPAQVRPGKPAALMVLQDGASYIDLFPIVFDNLIADGGMPVTVGVFIDPGRKLDEKAEKNRSSNRAVEYDTVSDRYVRFLMDEILPEVEKVARLNKDPRYRLIFGASSGGICSFTAAWQRPDQFGKVMSWVGSFTNIGAGDSGLDGGQNYPTLIRKTPRKPIRVFLQDGRNDLDNRFGNSLANESMARALQYARYDSKIVWGNGFHLPDFGRSILPDSLRWLWRDHTNPEPAPVGP